MSNTPKYDPALAEALARKLWINDFAPITMQWEELEEKGQEPWLYRARGIIIALDTCGYTVVPKDDGR